MKKYLVWSFVWLLWLVNPALAAEGLTKIANNVYAYIGEKAASPANSFGANAGIVIGRDGVLVVDTLISAKEADRFIADIRKITDKPIKYVVNTHYHPDHALGNSEFSKLGAVIVSQSKDEASLEKDGPGMLANMQSMGLSDEDMRGTELAVATLTFTDRMTINLGDEKVELIYPGPSHSAGSSIVLVTQEKVLFTGDVLFTDYHPYMADGNVASWIKVLDFVRTLDAIVIIPGHGPLSGKKEVADMKAYLQIFDKKARKLAARSKDVEKIAAELKKELPVRSQLDWAIAENVKGLYLPKKKE